ncbi:hypothetical protein B0H11DRAFT_2188881 [Mycena galericulata]|nr:hypothetical protein B0H11DRAFT_2188881 [Mycena galericulata]
MFYQFLSLTMRQIYEFLFSKFALFRSYCKPPDNLFPSPNVKWGSCAETILLSSDGRTHGAEFIHTRVLQKNIPALAVHRPSADTFSPAGRDLRYACSGNPGSGRTRRRVEPGPGSVWHPTYLPVGLQLSGHLACLGGTVSPETCVAQDINILSIVATPLIAAEVAARMLNTQPVVNAVNEIWVFENKCRAPLYRRLLVQSFRIRHNGVFIPNFAGNFAGGIGPEKRSQNLKNAFGTQESSYKESTLMRSRALIRVVEANNVFIKFNEQISRAINLHFTGLFPLLGTIAIFSPLRVSPKEMSRGIQGYGFCVGMIKI